MTTSSHRVAARWAKAQANWTLPYLEKLIETAVNDPTGWGESSPAARVLRQMVKSSGFGNLDPFPVGELWDYLASYDVDSDEIAVMKKARPPRTRKKKVGPTFYEAYRDFEQATGKHLILHNIDLETDHHLAPALLAITKAVSKLPKRAARLWQSEVKKVMLVGRNKSTEDASWRGADGLMRLVIGKSGFHSVTQSVPIWRKHIVHELGHALEDKLNLVVTAWSPDPYGHEPFISAYAEKNASEDFAETFQTLEMEPSHLRRVAPAKYEDMKNRF